MTVFSIYINKYFLSQQDSIIRFYGVTAGRQEESHVFYYDNQIEKNEK